MPKLISTKDITQLLDFSPINNFTIALTGDFKSKAAIVDPNSANATLARNTILGSLFLGYGEKNKYSFGVEGVYQIDQNGWKNSEDILPVEFRNVNALGISAFGSYQFSEDLAALVRYDYFDPNMDTDFKGDSRNYFIAGVDFKADKNISIIPNVIYESYEEDSILGLSFDPSVTARVTLYYNF